MYKMNWQQYEIFISELFRKHGYKVEENPKSGKDGGVDLRLRKDKKKYVVQIKHHKSKVSAPVVQQILGCMFDIKEKADGAKVVALKGFTRDAKNFAKGNPIELINAYDIVNMI